jgi:CspA family cold shock protein
MHRTLADKFEIAYHTLLHIAGMGDTLEIAVAKRHAQDAIEKLKSPGEAVEENVTGTVKFFNEVKGFGFIARDDGNPDVFVHISDVLFTGHRSLVPGARFEFNIEQNRFGKLVATTLRRLDSGA